jgi:DNA-binding response OmpR family regulator
MDQQAQPNPAPRKVLCIEDEHFISELYARALSKAGYEVTVIVDGEEGLKAAQTNQFDIILLDIMVPNLSGTEILKKLRDTRQTPELKARVLITTNLEQREEIREAIERQADGYIIKAELTPKELVAVLDNLT